MFDPPMQPPCSFHDYRYDDTGQLRCTGCNDHLKAQDIPDAFRHDAETMSKLAAERDALKNGLADLRRRMESAIRVHAECSTVHPAPAVLSSILMCWKLGHPKAGGMTEDKEANG